MNKTGTLRIWINRVVGIAMIILVLGIALAYLWLNTGRGLDWLSQKTRVWTDGIVEINGLSGQLPFHLTARQLILRDHNQLEWLRAEEISTRTDLRGLLGLELALEETRVESVEWSHFPHFQSQQAARAGTGPYDRVLPAPLVALRLDRATIGHFFISTNIIMHEFEGSLQGTARWYGEDDIHAEATGPFTAGRVTSNHVDAIFKFENGVLKFPRLDIVSANQTDSFQGVAAYTIQTRALASTGRLDVADTSLYRPFHMLDFKGPLRANVGIEHQAKGFPWEFKVGAESRAFTYQFITNLDMNASGSISLTRSSTTYQLAYKASGVTLPSWSFEHVAIQGAGTNIGFKLNLAGEGKHQSGHSFTLRSAHEIDGNNQTGAWTVLTPDAEGSLNRQPIRIQSPARYAYSNLDHQVDIPAMALAGGTGSISFRIGDAHMSDLVARLSDADAFLLTALLNQTSKWVQSGTKLDLALDAMNLVQEPHGVAMIHVRDIQIPHPLVQPFAGSSISITGRLEKSTLRAHASFSHPLVEQFEIDASGAVVTSDRMIPVAMDLEKGVDAHVRLRGELSPISREIANTSASLGGRVELDMIARHLPRQPRFDGFFEIRGGQFRQVITGTFLEEINARLRGENNGLVIEQAVATDGGSGRLNANGTVSFDEEWSPAWTSQLELDRISLFRLIKTDLPLTGTIQSKGDATRANVNGEVWLEPSAFLIPRRLPPDIRVLDVTEINHPDPARNQAPAVMTETTTDKTARSASRPFELNISVQTRDAFEVKGRGLQSEWNGFVSLGGDSRNPVLTGTNRITKGYAMLLGRRFNIDRGQIIFTGELPPEPRLNIEASTRIGDVVARLIISGTTDQPMITLASEPMMTENEIMSVILFGKSAETMSPWQAIALANGLRVLGGQGGDLVEILDAGQNVLKLDQIELKQDEKGEGFSSLSVGKYIGPTLYIEGEKGMGGSEDRFTASLELPKRFVLETESSPRIREGVRLLWRRDF